MKLIEFHYTTWDNESDTRRAEKAAIAVLELLEEYGRNLYEVFTYDEFSNKTIYYSSLGIKEDVS